MKNPSVSKWKKFVPVLKECFTRLCADAIAGRISPYFFSWTSITSNKEIPSDIRGMGRE